MIVKGWCGFGDRLESLKMCVKFAITYNVPIYVDWRDTIWSGGKESFYTYFKLNLPSFELDDIPDDISAFPPFWNGRVKDILNETLSKDDVDIGDNFKPCVEDVLVVSCVGNRQIYNDSAFFTKVFRIIDPRVIEEVRLRQKTYKLSDKWGIHLRGTDRSTRINKQDRISAIAVKLVANGLFNGAQLVVVSDDNEFIDMWKKRFPEFPVLTKMSSVGSVPLHLMDNQTISKDQVNVELLVDFLTLASCARVFSTMDDSRYAVEAKRLHSALEVIIS